ncbi:MAG: hypothetical protein JXB30_12485 [Anaerolineae bacterium]|nr:hypothetical protein [Anaerolineae bacterium]
MAKTTNLYTLEVCIIGGPISSEFADKNPIVSRTIQIRGDQTLADLHRVIFEALDREEEHMYEFQIGGKGPNDPNARCYGLSSMMGDTEVQGDVARTQIDTLKLKNSEPFGYWFDFGDDWWHQIVVTAIEEKAPSGDYPKVIARVGQSPPQYMDFDE